MLIILSPAKNLDLKRQSPVAEYTQPEFLKEAEKLVRKIKTFSKKDLSGLMNINERLTNLNYERFKKWGTPFTPENAQQALMAFNGDVYTGLQAESLSSDDLHFAQDHVRILSGLYGVLRPLDLIQPYRLEMGTKLSVQGKDDLYAFWRDKITTSLNETLETQSSKVLINLASQEYFKSVDTKKLNAEKIITPVFKELRGDTYRMFFVFVKRARGMMTRFILLNQLKDPEEIKGFDMDGYFYNDNLSTDTEWVFTR